jgi:hypothetical protein
MRIRHLMILTAYVGAFLASYSYWASDRSLIRTEKIIISSFTVIPVTIILGSIYLIPARCPHCGTWSLGPLNPFRLPFLFVTQKRHCIVCHDDFVKRPGTKWVPVKCKR